MIYQHRRYGMVTPAITLTRGSKINTEATAALTHFLKKSGAKGILIAGSTGYAPMLSDHEHKDLIEKYLSCAKDDGLVSFVGIGRNSLDETLELGRFAIDSGADKLVIVTPYYIKEDQNQLYRYYSKLLSKLDAGIFIYNVPSLTGNNIEADTVVKLKGENDNLEGVKSTNTDFNQFQRLIYYTERDFLVFQGYDHLLLPSLEIGASGGVCGTTNFINLAVKLYAEYNKKNMGQSIKLHKALSSIYHILEPYEFPEIYNVMFYKFIMGKHIGATTGISTKISKKDIDAISRKIRSVLP
ncbi:dihydrodipicolinate synthase [mine drainage metagenome]|uniref:Dihydrodipicolinate synthase n=1 Tax=mine drainage metagenome TaxID=410659 RepID=T0YU50_9ZZZZ